MPGPPQVIRELWVGAQGIDGIQFLGQGRLGEHGVELPVTGGAELDLGAEPAAPRAGHEVVRCEPQRLSFAELADPRLDLMMRRQGIW